MIVLNVRLVQTGSDMNVCQLAVEGISPTTTLQILPKRPLHL